MADYSDMYVHPHILPYMGWIWGFADRLDKWGSLGAFIGSVFLVRTVFELYARTYGEGLGVFD